MHRVIESEESTSTMRTVAGESVYGAKCARLLELGSMARFSESIPAIYPLSSQLGERFLFHHPGAEALAEQARAEAFGQWLSVVQPELLEEVRQQCGAAPWIVRSSGPEDSPDLLESGVFTSIVCETDAALPRTLADVIFSGFRSHTAAYLHRTGRRPAPVPVFIQPLVRSGETIAPFEDRLPAISLPLVEELESFLLALHRNAWPCTLICEWMIEGSAAVSATTITTAEDVLGGDMWCGFGRASAQTNLGGAQNSRMLWVPGVSRPLLSGGPMLAMKQGKWRLLQVRPTARWPAAPMVPHLGAGEHERLLRHGYSPVASAEVIVAVAMLPIGTFIVADSISWAWYVYSSMPDGEREEVKAAFVATGSSAEHAGIMFRQQGIMVARLQADAIPAGAATVVADIFSGICYFSPSASPPQFALQAGEAPADLVPADASLYLEPGDATSLPSAEAESLARSLFRSSPANPYEVLLNHPALPAVFREVAVCEFLSPQQRARVLRQSLAGAPDGRITDPHLGTLLLSWLGLYGVFAPGLNSAFCQDAVASMAKDHPLRAYLISRWQSQGLLPVRRQLSAEVLEILAAKPAPPPEWESLLDALASESPENQLCVVRLLDLFQDALTALDLYTPQECSQLWQVAVALLRVSGAAAILRPLMTATEVTATDLVWWLQHAVRDAEKTTLAMSAYRHARQCVRGLATGATGYAIETVTALVALRQALMDRDAPAGINLVAAAVDAFDLGGKRLLNSMAVHFDLAVWQDYVALLFCWLEFLGQMGAPVQNIPGGVAATEIPPLRFAPVGMTKGRVALPWRSVAGLSSPSNAVLQVLKAWLSEHAEPPALNDFTLQSQHWTVWVRQAETDGQVQLPNVHQLQNILHQMSLGIAAEPETAHLPLRVQHLLRFANTFRKRRNRLLRFESSTLEIERSMGIHKASLVFTPQGFATEFYEPPSATADELARLEIFQGLLVRFNQWWPELTFVSRKEHLAGSFGLHIWTTAKNHRFACEALVMMFDMSYDLSGIETPLGDLRDRFTHPGWGPFFTAMVAYRGDLDDSRQHVALRSYPLGHFLFNTVLNPELETWLSSWLGADFNRLYREIQARAMRFSSLKASIDDWADGKRRLDLLSLLCAVTYPQEAWEALSREPLLGWGFDALGRSLLRRRSMVENINPEPVDEFARFLLRHVPDVVLRSENAVAMARAVSSRPARQARASAFLVHRFAMEIPRETLRILLDSMVLVPFGASPSIEALLRQEAPGKARYNILYPLTVRPASLAEMTA